MERLRHRFVLLGLMINTGPPVKQIGTLRQLFTSIENNVCSISYPAPYFFFSMLLILRLRLDTVGAVIIKM